MNEEIPSEPIIVAEQPEVILQPQTFIERYSIHPVLFGFMALGIIFILYQVVGGVLTIVLFGMEPTQNHAMGLRAITGLGQLLFILVPTIFLVKLATAKPLNYLRLRKPTISTLLLPLVGTFSLQQLLQIYLVYQEKIPLPKSVEVFLQEFKDKIEQAYNIIALSSSLPELLFVVLVIAIVPAIVEELLFRGLVQRSFESVVTPMRAAVITGCIFGFYHLNPFSLVALVCIGIYLGFIAVRADNIIVSMAAHFYNNAIACVVLYFFGNDEEMISGNPSNMSNVQLLLWFVLFGIIFGLSIYFFMRATSAKREPAIQEGAGIS